MSGGIEVSLGKVIDLNPTFKSGLLSPDELVDFLPMAAVDEGRSIAEAKESRELQEVQKGYTSFSDGDVLLAKITPCFENGKIAQVHLKNQCGFGSTEFHVLRPHADKLDGRYLVHFLRRDQVRIDGERKMTGSAGQRRVPKHFLETLSIRLPHLSEQRRIAAILDQADTLRAKRREALAQLDSLTQSIFIEMFGDPMANNWKLPRRKIGEIGTVITGNTPPRENSGNYGNDIEWIKSDNINTPSYYITKAAEGLSETGRLIARIAPAESILVTCIAGSPDCIGNSAMTDREVAFNQQINAFIPKVGNAHFYYAQFIVGKRLIQEASTNGMKGMVSKGRFEQISLIVPPEDQQQDFTSRVMAIQKLSTAHHVSLCELDALFTSLQHRAFHGKL